MGFEQTIYELFWIAETVMQLLVYAFFQILYLPFRLMFYVLPQGFFMKIYYKYYPQSFENKLKKQTCDGCKNVIVVYDNCCPHCSTPHRDEDCLTCRRWKEDMTRQQCHTCNWYRLAGDKSCNICFNDKLTFHETLYMGDDKCCLLQEYDGELLRINVGSIRSIPLKVYEDFKNKWMAQNELGG